MRLFFGLSVQAPWPEELSRGRLLDPEHRHITLAFLGETEQSLSDFPKPSFRLGPAGLFDACLLLPPRRANVVAFGVSWGTGGGRICSYREELVEWLERRGFARDERSWLPHVTLARQPFDGDQWEASFHALPMYVDGVHLYESRENLRYMPILSHRLVPPWEECEHTADVAFRVRGETLAQVLQHAELALAWHCPNLLVYREECEVRSSGQVVESLNHLIARVDMGEGAPYKAVSYAGEVVKRADGLLEWEMIVDV